MAADQGISLGALIRSAISLYLISAEPQAAAREPKAIQTPETTLPTPEAVKTAPSAIPPEVRNYSGNPDAVTAQELVNEALTQEEEAILAQIHALKSEPVDPTARPIVPSTAPMVPGATFENPDPLAAPPSMLERVRALREESKKSFDVRNLIELPNMQF
jgi:hypothetical protein